ncbi:MAG: N-acetyltransferase [Deltaproteobacteria bacterium]|nr:N-acetyltransferase [Deltaproteobacteria bacterium]
MTATDKVLIIKVSEESERKDILNIHMRAFGNEPGVLVSKLVDDLFDDETATPILSLVAVDNNKLVGHALFTKVEITQSKLPVSAQILAPLAILPESQNCGIGQKLIYEGLNRLKKSGTQLVFVLGHPSYYPRCGFVKAVQYGLVTPHPIPKKNFDGWMVQELNGNVLGKIKGKVKCSKALNEPQHWIE